LIVDAKEGKKMTNKRIFTAAALLIFFLFTFTPSAWMAETLTVAVNQSQVVTLPGVERVAVANPDIADVIIVSGYEALIIGKSAGVTSLHVWSYSGRQSFLVEVAVDDVPLARSIETAIGYPNLRVSKLGRTIILEGSVDTQPQKERAEKLASIYGDKVINLLALMKPVQIKIEAQVIEIDRQKAKDLGIKWGNGVGAAFSPGGFAAGQDYLGQNGWSLGNFGQTAALNAQLSALVKEGSARILSRPNMITLSGDKANIMVGGEIPIPVSLQNGSIGIEWKEYGIKLEIGPELSSANLIHSKIKAEVSSLDWNSSHKIQLGTNMAIPPIKMRKAETAIALGSGQTMAIGGLISSETTRDVYKIPLLADLPILGALFKSTSFNRSETELLILITPTVVDPASYQPEVNPEMKEFSKENPWGGSDNAGKD
jgi:pilus assembly protein CpaC